MHLILEYALSDQSDTCILLDFPKVFVEVGNCFHLQDWGLCLCMYSKVSFSRIGGCYLEAHQEQAIAVPVAFPVAEFE